LDTNEIFYVGMGSNKRATSLNNRNELWKRIVNKTEYVVEIVSENLTWEDACELECLLIKEYGRLDDKTGKLCNFTNGGDGSVGIVRSQKTRKLLSDALKNRKFSNDTIVKMKKAKENKYYLDDNPNSKKVINIETGEIFNTLKEAASSINMNYGSFKWSIRKAKKFNFKYYN
jgi:hypothetical protein